MGEWRLHGSILPVQGQTQERFRSEMNQAKTEEWKRIESAKMARR